MYRPVLVTPPAITPVTRAEVKSNSRIDHDDDDARIDALIAAATSYLDGWTGILGRCLVEQTWRQDFDRLGRCLRLPLAPVTSLTSLKYFDLESTEQTIAAENYELLHDDDGSYVRLMNSYSVPSHRYGEGPSASVTYKVGYPNTGSDPNFTSTVPAAIKQAMLLLIGHWYEHRETVIVGQMASTVPFAVDALLAPFRRVRF